MQAARACSLFGLVALIGCGGTFTHEGDGTTGGSGGSSNSAGSVNHGGDAGSAPKGGDAGYGAVSGDISYGATGGDVGGYGGDISYGGTVGSGGDISYGATGGDISYGGDAGYAGTGGGTSCGYMPMMAPVPVKFTFTTNMPLYLRQDCSLGFNLYTCDGDETSSLNYEASCVADCSASGDGCVACGACPLGATEVTGDAPAQSYWGGELYTYGTLASGCPCATGQPAASGEYTISVMTYFSAADAMSGTNGIEHRQAFTYPPPGGAVNVFVGFLGI